jgi:signal transduction histidine kinase
MWNLGKPTIEQCYPNKLLKNHMRRPKIKGFSALATVTILSIAVLVFSGSGSTSDGQQEKLGTKRVLLLYSYHEGLPWEKRIDESFRNALASQTAFSIEINVEHTDRVRFADSEYRRKLIDLYRYKYSHPGMDLVIGVDEEAVNVLLDYGAELFPGIPMVLITAERKTLQRDLLKPNMISLLWEADIRANVELIGEILPQTRHIFIVMGTSTSDRELLKLAQESLREDAKGYAIHYLTDLSAEDLIQKATQLPKQSAILYLAFSRDAEGKSFVPRKILSTLSKQVNVPVFGIIDTYLGYGIVGGQLLSAEMEGKRCAEIALRILRGESPVDMIPKRTLNQLMFDWRQLKRWGISEAKLPPGSIVRFKEFSIWEQYKWHILGLTTFCIVEFLLIAWLWIQRRRRSQAEQEVRESEAKFASIFQSTPVPMFLLDQNRRIREANRTAQEAVALSALEMEGLSFGNAFRCIHSLDDPKGCGFGPSCDDCPVRRIILNTFQTGQSHHQVELRLTSGDWSERHHCYLLLSTALPDIAQNRFVLLYVEDITKRKYAQQEAQRHRNELALMSRRARLGELTASITHELKQPLAAILSNAQAALRFLSSDAPDLNEVHDSLQDIVRDDKRAGEVIKRLHVPLKKSVPVFRPVDLNEVMLEIIELLKNEMDLRGVSLVTMLAEGLPAIRGDTIQLQQVALNLIMNGAEAMVDLDHDSRKIIVSTKKHDEQTLEVSVRDSGRGLDEDIIDRMFDPFYTTKSEGMGMGLSISRSIIETHGGRLWAANNPDRGATLSFTVPISGGGQL